MNTNRSCYKCREPSGVKSICKHCEAAYQRERAFAFREVVRAYKLKMGCFDCGYATHHAGLEFDHREGEIRLKSVATFAFQGNMSATWAEISKCDVVCGTCHRIRTWERKQKGKLA